jgi:hypothetical protein
VKFTLQSRAGLSYYRSRRGDLSPRRSASKMGQKLRDLDFGFLLLRIYYGVKPSCSDIACPPVTMRLTRDLESASGMSPCAYTRLHDGNFSCIRIPEKRDGIIFHRWYRECASRWVEFYERVVKTKKCTSGRCEYRFFLDKPTCP